MKIAICGDEQVCIDCICTLINAYCTGRRLTCNCHTFTDPLVFGEGGLVSYDVVFLDDNMGEMGGIAAAKALREVNRTAILVYISAFVESFRYQILLHLYDDKILESWQHSLSELTALLIPYSFLRIHKSLLVNPEHIAAIKNRVVTLHSGETLSCGKADYADILRAFTLWKAVSKWTY